MTHLLTLSSLFNWHCRLDAYYQLDYTLQDRDQLYACPELDDLCMRALLVLVLDPANREKCDERIKTWTERLVHTGYECDTVDSTSVLLCLP